jgi:hypothetical protein
MVSVPFGDPLIIRTDVQGSSLWIIRTTLRNQYPWPGVFHYKSRRQGSHR